MDVTPEEDGPGHGGGAEAGPDVVEGEVEAAAASGALAALEGQDQLDGAVIVEVGHGDADHREAPGPDERAGDGQEGAGRLEHGGGAISGPGQRVGAGHPGEIVEAQPEHDGAPGPAGAAQPAGDPVDEADENGVDGVGPVPSGRPG